MTNIFVYAAFLKQFTQFYSKDASRWVLHGTICIKKLGDTLVEFAATDGQKLLVVRRPLEETESIKDGEEYIVPIELFPMKGKYLKYLLTISEGDACFNDGENVYHFPTKKATYPDYRKLIETARQCEKVKNYVAFRWENLKALYSVMGDKIYDVPKENGHAYLWSNEELNGRAKYVLICSHLLNN